MNTYEEKHANCGFLGSALPQLIQRVRVSWWMDGLLVPLSRFCATVLTMESPVMMFDATSSALGLLCKYGDMLISLRHVDRWRYGTSVATLLLTHT